LQLIADTLAVNTVIDVLLVEHLTAIQTVSFVASVTYEHPVAERRTVVLLQFVTRIEFVSTVLFTIKPM
jgi:hypothetical protein